MSMALILMAALAGAAPEALRPARSSAEQIAGYAMARICLPLVRDGADFDALARKGGSPWRAVPGAYALNGTTPNFVQRRGDGCYFKIDRGDRDRMRDAILGALASAGAAPREPALFDSGVDGGGPLRQESHCLLAKNSAGEPLALLISRRIGRSAAPSLQASLYPEPKQCAVP